MTVGKRCLGGIAVDSGTIVIGDPGLLLPTSDGTSEGIDFAAVVAAPGEPVAQLLAGRPVQLIQGFGGDGDYPVYGEFEDGRLVAVTIRFDEALDADE
jgi:hypothetical protein